MTYEPLLDVLLPTYSRHEPLIMTLAGLAGQTLTRFHLLVADQGEVPAEYVTVVTTLCRIIRARGGSVEWHHRPERRGIAEQRQFLLERASADHVLCLDDDVFMEPWVMQRLVDVLQEQGCGFVGAHPAHLGHQESRVPDTVQIEFWDGPVRPEIVQPRTPEWQRLYLNRYANLYHIGRALPTGETRLYKVAWVGACVLYDRRKLLEVGGFSFWTRLPLHHNAEEALVQNLLMRRWGGCGIVPTGTYLADVPSTARNRAGAVDASALALLPEMVERYASGPNQA